MEKLKVLKSERWIIASLGALAAVRVFLFAAAWPFFSNIDEAAQFDVVAKYSRFEVPRSLAPVSEESARYLSVFGSPEYSSVAKPPAPVWTHPLADAAGMLNQRQNWWQHVVAASYFHRRGRVDVLVGSVVELLERRIYLAWQACVLQVSRPLLHDFLQLVRR